MEEELNDSKGHTIVQSVERALTLLEALGEAGQPMNITQLASKVDMKLSTVHRLLSSLGTKGFIEQEPETGKYRLGLKLFQLGNIALYSADIRTIARPYLKELVERCNETANLAILDGAEVVYIDQIESTNMVIVKMFARVGSRGPAHCTGSGKVLLAGLPDEELNKLLKTMTLEKFTDETITDPEKLKKELERVRREGYAQDLGERDEGVRCVAAPIKNHEGRVVAALSVSGPAMRITTYQVNNELTDMVKEVAMKVSKRLGYREVQ